MQSKTTILHLSLIDHVGPVLIHHVIEHITFEQCTILYHLNVQELKTRCALTTHQAQLIHDGLQNKEMLDQELTLCNRFAIQWTTRYDDKYPQSLLHLHAPPAVLYFQGQLPENNTKTIAFIGSRQANWYAKEVMHLLIPPLVQEQFTTVSGGAIGADTLAHQETLAAKGRTVAILGSGLLNPYPKQNERLFKTIVAEGGAVISPFSLRTQPLPGNFPARNRIIAGLSQAVIIIQAAKKSGTLITAHYALEQGIDVGVVPGAITDPLSSGCHDLIKQGATIITTSDDILELLGHEPVKNNQKASMQPNHPLHTLLEACIQAQTFDELIQATKLSPIELQEQLIGLQLEGKLTQDFLGRWQRI